MAKQLDRQISDPNLYDRLCEPFPSVDSANDSLDDFFMEFRELREKYGIPDVVLIVRSIYMDQGEKQDALLTMSCGDANLVLPMVATAYERQKNKFISDLGLITIPASMMDNKKFFSAYLRHRGLAKTEEEAESLIKNGEIKVNGKLILVDGPAPDNDFNLTFRGDSLKIPGRKKKQ